MSDKLKNILHTAWTEPRHFFFWLAMLSILAVVGLCEIAAAEAGTEGLAGHPTLLFAWIIGGAILCLLASILAFILAWIPPVRRTFSWPLRQKLLTVGCVVTLVALFYAIEDWRGRCAWRNYKHAWEAKGERFDLASFVPPLVPDDENFFETPLWDDLRFAKTKTVKVWNDMNWDIPSGPEVYPPTRDYNRPSTDTWAKAQRLDLARWQAYYRGANNLFAARGGPPTNYFPVAKEPQTPAADVLLALSKFDGTRQLLIAAAARPQARFWINYDAGFFMLLPHLARLGDTSHYLALHATAALKAGDKSAALEDIRLLFRLAETIRSEPTLPSHIVRTRLVQGALQPVWEGLADRQWTEAELGFIEGELGRLDFLADYQFTLRGERACNLRTVEEYYQKAGNHALDEILVHKSDFWLNSGQARLYQFLALTASRLMPAGWLNQSKISLCRSYEQYTLPVVDLPQRAVSPALAKQWESAFNKLRPRPYDLFSNPLLEWYLPSSADRFAWAQSSVDLARVACALERYRLANGQFPAALEALTPKFMDKLPHDVIGGQPLHYRRTDDGQFVLYSVGWNETDDGGKVPVDEWDRVDRYQGDWVWRYPAR